MASESLSKMTNDTYLDLLCGLDENILKYMPETVRFAILRLGKDCNASGSHAFTDARCSVAGISDEKKVMMVRNFNKVFRRGIDFMNELKSGDLNSFENMETHNKAAIIVLAQFLKEKELHEKSLNNVLNRQQSEGDGSKSKPSTETELTVALAEHLLGRLAPGQSYIIDSRAKGKGRCSCGEKHCRKDPKYGSTGIGHEEVWHGYVDIMFSSHEGIEPESIACALKPTATDFESLTPVKKLKADDAEEEEDKSDGSPGGKTIVEVKQSTIGAEDQSVAETIVFSLIQRIRHPDFKNHLIPNIVITSCDFRILMYDAVNDVFLCSMLLPIFQDNCLHITSVLILWMVLHYRIFCSGIDIDPEKIKQVQSKFRDIVGEKWEIYSKSLKTGVAKFPVVKKDTFPSNEGIMLGTEMF